ncbi:DUF4142 domain-containing protein [Taibaiella chishuiensis]|uniref:Putative membrane protein n=1 Tax=Taibaiella chishuiensis TaxID=1434707 RepID=A0A2P8D374_9BACT|nr:DUF4142 domain-containing protein [Taibaiella chishuiensis]PSK91671.1 putative membrane protein [Taibaiella chishuiensis]
MKKLRFLIVSGLLLAVLQSCGNAGDTGKDSKETADSINEARTDNPPATPSTPASPVSEDDAKFAVDAASGGMAEVNFAELAKQKGANTQVRDFATMMITDHTKANDELKAIAQRKNIVLPADLTDGQKDTRNGLEKRMGADFDKAYIALMTDEHKRTIKMFEDASGKVTDADLKAFIDKTLPALKQHLEHVESIRKIVK